MGRRIPHPRSAATRLRSGSGRRASKVWDYDHIFVLEHLLGFRDDPEQTAVGAQTTDARWDEPLVLFGFLAGITRRVELVTGVLVAPIRQTVLLAKQTAEVDVLSGGRLRLGVGVGWNPRESEALGQDYGTRGRRIEEQVAVLRGLWTEPAMTFAGEWHDLNGVGIAPRPARPIPLWMGGMADRAIERAARLADGWMPLPIDPNDDEARTLVGRFRRHAERLGRARESLGLEGYLSLSWVPADKWERHVDAWRDLGATHLTVTTTGAGLTTAQEHVDALGRVLASLNR